MESIPYPDFLAKLPRFRAARIRFQFYKVNQVGGPRTRWMANTAYDLVSPTQAYESGGIDDILSGIASLDATGKDSLNTGCLHSILACNKQLSTDLIALGLAVDARQARRYMAAAKLAIFHIERYRTKLTVKQGE